ncbi:Na/Pi cotransporter family protein [Magnetospirillum sulfuroxidans]|uniref:Na/Pi cotransporter family protein n=1 Tax=Magnetospirillum sulfuroxidans TaxID=611300 RepID=A0ABS5ID94_9PROT|nr:Na/Pi cotransporter family protein [Magnetospirillum sulfuroxidans]
MNEAIVLINILGAAALLLWGLRMVSAGVMRAFGAALRRWINKSADSRLKTAGMGCVVTVALQSSTATCLMAASFVGRGLMSVDMAQAVMLGANVGTSLVVKFLTFDIGPVSAILVLAGVGLFRSGSGHRRHWARVLIGLGLMLLSLHLLDVASEPLRQSAQLRQMLHDLDGAWLIAVVLAAVLAMLAHSSVASILLILPLAAKGDFGLAFGLALILGANLGSALSPVLETGRENPMFRRVPLGNLMVRAAGCLAALPFLDTLARGLDLTGMAPIEQLVGFHIAFNLGLAVAVLPLTRVIARVLAILRPEVAGDADPRQPRHLDPSALESPAVAIGAAAREALRIGDVVETMLRHSLEMLRDNDGRLGGEIGRADDVVDALHEAVKLYLAQLSNEDLDNDDRRRASDIMTFVINLEHIGDIVDRNLKDLAERKIKRHLSFSAEGLADITALFALTQDNLRTALAVFMSGDARLARQLVEDKAEIRTLERNATEAHLQRIGSGRRESIETSALHLDILRDLKRINAHIASVAYPILEHRGELGATRLRIGAA